MRDHTPPTINVPRDNPENKAKEINSELIKANLSEFDSAKREIQNRSNIQGTIITSMITTIGVIATVYFSKISENRLFFIVPVISFILSMSWLDHDVTIRNIGDFIKDDIKAKLAKNIGVDINLIADYERRAELDEGRPGLKFSTFGLPTLVLFLWVPVGSMILPFYMEAFCVKYTENSCTKLQDYSFIHVFFAVDSSFRIMFYADAIFLLTYTLCHSYVWWIRKRRQNSTDRAD